MGAKPTKPGARGTIRIPRRLRANRAESSRKLLALRTGLTGLRSATRFRTPRPASTDLPARVPQSRSEGTSGSPSRGISGRLAGVRTRTECENGNRHGSHMVERDRAEVTAVPTCAAVAAQDPDFTRGDDSLSKRWMGKSSPASILGSRPRAGNQSTIDEQAGRSERHAVTRDRGDLLEEFLRAI